MKNLPDRIEVEVTEADIQNGMRGDCACCPIARALKRLYPEYHVWVRLQVAYLDQNLTDWCYSNLTNWCYSLPREAQIFINNFDLSVPTKPFTFHMERTENPLTIKA